MEPDRRGVTQRRTHALAGRILAQLGWAAAALLLLAAMPPAARGEDDLPGRVGRVADVAGELYLAPQDRPAEWAPIGRNYTVISGDTLWVAAEGRAEVDYGGGQFRLAGDTSLHLSRLDDSRLALFVAQGRVIVRVRALEAGDAARLDAPNTQVQLTRVGLYRIEVTPDRQTTIVTVREGEARVALAAGAQQALPGQTVTVTGPDPVAADVRNGIGEDDFDVWSANRDRYYEQEGSAAYVSQQMVGYADLDQHGTWQQYPDYGAVWFPNAVAPDWAPYSDGYWTNVGDWGYTWVDYAPWGYAPFHYGRWASIGGRWGWCPGQYVARPYWAPALVAWLGGPGWGLSRNFGAPVYGWLPLGRRDPYLPHWRGCSHRCWTQFNHPHGVTARERPRAPPSTYANSRVPGAITAVSGETIAGARPVRANRVRVPAEAAATAPVLGTPPPLTPRLAHVPAARPGAGAPPPASTIDPSSRSRTGTAEAGTGAPAAMPQRGPAPIGNAPAGTNAVPSMRVAPRTPAGAASSGSRATPYPVLPPNAAEPAPASTQPPARVAAPPPATPAGGGRVVASPPVRMESKPPMPQAAGVSAPATMARPPAPGAGAGGTAPVARPGAQRMPPAGPPSMQPGMPPANAAVAPPRGIPQQAVPGSAPPALPRQAVPGSVPQGLVPAAPQGGAAAPVPVAPTPVAPTPAGHGAGRPPPAVPEAPQTGGQRGAPLPAPPAGSGLTR